MKKCNGHKATTTPCDSRRYPRFMVCVQSRLQHLFYKLRWTTGEFFHLITITDNEQSK